MPTNREKIPFFLRLILVFPIVTVMGVIWGLIGLFSTRALGLVLKKTGERFISED